EEVQIQPFEISKRKRHRSDLSLLQRKCNVDMKDATKPESEDERPNREMDPTPKGEDSKADAAALELMKQLIALASGVLALSAAFADKLPKVPIYVLFLLLASWIALVVSISFGLKTISAIVKSRLNFDTEWSRGAGRTFGKLCRYGFLTGLILFASFAFVSLIFPSSKGGEIKITIQADDPRLIETLRAATEHPEVTRPQVAPGEKATQGDKSVGRNEGFRKQK
ncbi:MAG: hypothetical protein M1587_07265, partial [Thaumarchaeota archaeon]|nr:hypothetical protein [Nitrososphaerota archaeon]